MKENMVAKLISFVPRLRSGDRKKLIVCCMLFFAMLLCGGCAGQRFLFKDDGAKSEPSESKEEKYSTEKGEGIARDDEAHHFISKPLEDIPEAKDPARFYAEDTRVPPAEKVQPPLKHRTPEDIKDRSVARAGKKSKKSRAPSQAGQVVLNFDNADLYEVIRNFAEILNINYIVDPNVQGKVTIHTAGQLRKEDIFPVFFQILEANGLTAIREGSLYKIVPIKEAQRLPMTPRFGDSEVSPEERIIIQIIPLKFISVQEITKLLTPFISADGTIVSHGDSNTLLVVDKGLNIIKILKLVETFDINMFEKVSHKIYQLEYTDAEEMADTLANIIASYGAKDDLKCIPIQRLNTLITISSNPYIFERIEELVRQIDVPGDDIEPRIYVYAVKNGEAVELAALLNSVFSRDSSAKEKMIRKEQTQKSQPAKKSETGTQISKAAFGSAIPQKVVKKTAGIAKSGAHSSGVHSSGTLKGEIRITPDEVRNALIIEAVPRDYQIIENILNRLDILPRQVLIEVKIAEITLDTRTDLGVKWWYEKKEREASGGSLLGTSVGGALFGVTEAYAGLQYIIGQTKRWEAAISALNTEKKINILSAPSVLASDNKEARIDISTEVPVASAQYQYNSDSEPMLQTNIQYRNTGIILTVTPHINEYGLVSMDISQEVSNQLEDNVKVGNSSLPAFFKRSVNTSLTVKHGQTIVIGGLIRETKNKGYAGVPCLGNMPVLQYLFGNKSNSIDKTELIILITPRVIATLEDVDAVTEAFKNKVGNIMD